MSDAKISNLPAATTPLAGTEVLPVVQSGTTKRVATNDLTVKNLRSNATTGILQVAGPAAASTRTMAVPDENFTAARTDAAQTFTGTQTFSSSIVGAIQGTAPTALITDTMAVDNTANWVIVGSGTTLTFDTDHYNLARNNIDARCRRLTSTTIGKTYRAIVQVKNGTAASASATITIANAGEAVQFRGVSTTAATWQTISIVFKATASTTYVYLWVLDNLGGNNVQFKNFSLQEVAYSADNVFYTTDNIVFNTSGGGITTNTAIPLGLGVNGNTNAMSIGVSSNVTLNTGNLVIGTAGNGIDFSSTASGIMWRAGTGSPEGSVTASVGSLYTRSDGGAGTTLYVKESGSGNTGWVGK